MRRTYVFPPGYVGFTEAPFCRRNLTVSTRLALKNAKEWENVIDIVTSVDVNINTITNSKSAPTIHRRNLKTQLYFLRLGPPPTLIRHENLAFRFRVDRKHFENKVFRERWLHVNHMIALTEFFSHTNPNWPVIIAFLNSTGVVWKENIWCVFRGNLCFQIPLAKCGWSFSRSLHNPRVMPRIFS